MSIVSNPSALMNGNHRGQQFSTLLSASNTISPMGDSPVDAKQKSTQPSNPHQLSHNESQLHEGHRHADRLSGDNGVHTENSDSSMAEEQAAASEEEAPCIDIIINNVVCSFSTRCYLNLKKVATEGLHVEYRRENGMLNMKIRRPNVTATIWSSGNITCTGSTSEEEARMSARRVARRLQRLGFNVRFCNYRVVNVLGTCSVNFGIKLAEFSEVHRQTASYEPELHPGVTYKIKEPKATLKIFSTGSITVTAPSVANVQYAVEHIYPLVVPHKMDVPHLGSKVMLAEKRALKKQGVYVHLPCVVLDDDDDEEEEEDDEDEFSDNGRLGKNGEGEEVEDDDDFSDDFDSDVSHD